MILLFGWTLHQLIKRLQKKAINKQPVQKNTQAKLAFNLAIQKRQQNQRIIQFYLRVMQVNSLSLNEDEQNLSCSYLQPRIYHTQPTQQDQTCGGTHKYKNSALTSFSCTIVNLKQKQVQNPNKKRKNAYVVAKSKRSNLFQAQEQSINTKLTPFKNRKDLEKKAIQQKLLEIKNKKDIASIISGNINKWLVIQQIPIQQEQRNLSKPEAILGKKNTQMQQTSCTINQNQNAKSNQKDIKQQKKKDKMSLYLKRSKKQKYYKKIETNLYQSAANLDSFSNLRVQNFSFNSTVVLNGNSSKQNNHSFTRLNSSKQRHFSLNSCKKRSSSPISQQNFKREAQFKKIELNESSLRCCKINLISHKSRIRPQTAVFSEKLAQSNHNKSKKTARAKFKSNEMTGWQDLRDSCQRQIYI